MNLLLVADNEVSEDHLVTLSDRRAEHIRAVLNAKVGDSLRVGIRDGNVGRGEILSLNDTEVCLSLSCGDPPPAQAPIRLVLALPRPKVARRVISAAVGFGVKEIVLLGAYRVEKSYWSSPLLSDAVMEETVTLALEQARDTLSPRIEKAQRFKPFVEDVLPTFAKGTKRFLFHPEGPKGAPTACSGPVTVAIGPDGGWTQYEAELLQNYGFEWVHFGPRILRVETAVSAVLGRLCQT